MSPGSTEGEKAPAEPSKFKAEDGKDIQVNSSSASLDELEEEERQEASPVAVSDLLKQPGSTAASPTGSVQKSALEGNTLPSADELLVAIPLGTPAEAEEQKPAPESAGPHADPSPELETVSLDVQTGEEEGSEAGNAATAEEPEPQLAAAAAADRPGKDAAPGFATPEAALQGTKSLESDAGTLVVHSSASDSPPVVEEDDSNLQPSATIGSQTSGVSSANAYFTARGEPEKADVGLDTPAGSRNLEESFQDISIEPKNGSEGKQAAPVGGGGRTGVNSSPPRSPKKEAAPSASQSREAAKGDGLRSSASSGAFRQDSNTVAEELQEAEAKAEAEALAASQRASSLRDQPNKKGPAEEGESQREAAPFTEENLQSAESGKVVANGDSSTVRPMSPPPAAARPIQAAMQEVVQSYEPPEYAGLVFHDGIDALGRPVVVVNADALAPGSSRKAAIMYMQQRLEPIIVQGPYVIVFLNSGSGSTSRLSPGWLASCYRQLSYPFRKNVKHVVLVRPSAGLKFMLAIVRPLLSPKAYVKVKKVASLAAMAAATNSEVTMQHLGPRFAAAMGQERLDREMAGG